MAIPYVLNNGSLGRFLDHIQTAKVPPKLDDKFLNSGGFTGKNEQHLKGYMRSLGFTEKDGTPTQRWHDHRHTANSKRIRAEAVRQAYAGFFDSYTDAQTRPAKDFENWARAEEPSASPTTINRALKTFEAMVKLADFDGASPAAPTEAPPAGKRERDDAALTPAPAPAARSLGMGGVTINIELQLPATAEAAFFDAFFASMSKHLKDD